jgi:hypothetical protein
MFAPFVLAQNYICIFSGQLCLESDSEFFSQSLQVTEVATYCILYRHKYFVDCFV